MTNQNPRQPSLLPPQHAEVTLVFDGGSLGNPGKGYGSFVLRGAVSTDEPVRLEFPGRTTNNEAEYMSLIEGLKAVLSTLNQQSRTSGDVSMRVFSDSKLVVEQVSGRWKVRHEGLRPLHAEAQRLLSRFGQWRLQWQPRSESVRLLGH